MSQLQTSGFKAVNGINMYYEIYGEGGVPLVLIHGGGSDIQVTFGRILHLLAANRQVIGVELDAHGHTSARLGLSSFEQDADDVAELLAQLGVTVADLFGFSNGGNTAMLVAIRYPELVRKLVAASAFFRRSGMHEWFFPFMETAHLDSMPPALTQAFLAINPSEEALKMMHDKDAKRMQTFTDWPDAYLQSIKAPTLLVFSDNDVMTVEHAAEMRRLIEGSRLIILPGGHGGYIGELMSVDPKSKLPGITAQLINEFLSEEMPA